MKFVKLSIFALTMGLFIASCGNNEAEAPAEDTAAAAPVAEPVAAPVDTAAAAPADTAAATAPAAEAPAAH